MKDPEKGGLAAIIRKNEAEILAEWIREQTASLVLPPPRL